MQGEKIYLPGGMVVDADTGPSQETMLLLEALSDVIKHLSVISLQLDLMLRMESNETSRAEIKSRIRRADEIQREQQEKSEEA